MFLNASADVLSTGNFIYNNYRQALTILGEGAETLEVLCTSLGVTNTDLERYLEQEREYLRSRKMERPEVVRKAEYVEALKRLDVAQ